ncbi:MAG: rRNA pseudouridine synthase [Bacteriovoracaceae bacterium]|jgi:23S rRNA pseudouridine2605 synthase|nr:rRNA pseudouridine synthase [Bacteriovoracaceae bacterium]
MTNSLQIRLQKAIADSGYTSRRKAEDLIVQGRVKVNGIVVTELGTKVSVKEDAIQVDGTSLDPTSTEKLYILLNKPRAFMTTLSDPEQRKTIIDLIPEISERVYPVGRLDYLSEGLLILTNDGSVANMIAHPRYEIEKVYEVKIFGRMNDYILKTLRSGVELEDGFAKPKSVRVIKQLPTKTWLEFRLQEGRNREIRRICEACGLTVDKLKRVAIGEVNIDGIAPGRYQLIAKNRLLRLLGIDADGQKVKSVNYRSTKKSIGARPGMGKKKTPTLLANDEKFHGLRKSNYYETLDRRKAIKAEIEAAKKAEYLKSRRP